jgi:hypothetical protein
LVRSTLRIVLFSGIFTLAPLEEVSVMVFTSTTKERRFVLGGGVSGVALNVTPSVAVPPPPTGGGEFFRAPLQEIKETADSNSSETKTFRKFMQPPIAEWVPSQRRARAPTYQG